MAIDKDKNGWFDELAGGQRGFKRSNPVKSKHSALSSEKSFNYKPELIDVMRIAKRYPQAVVKVSGFAHGAKHVSAHLSYISREGELGLENEEGEQIRGLVDQESQINFWKTDFDDDRKTSRDTAHLVLSLPPGTDRDKTLKAARDFLKNEFAEKGYEYVFTAHNDTEHPHVHACIKMRGKHRKKLTLRKAELHQLRCQFAKSCREQGIDVEASFRYERGFMGKSTKSPIAQLRKHKKAPKADIDLLKKIKADKKQHVQPSSEKNEAHSIDVPHKDKSKLKAWQVKALKQRQLIKKYYKDSARELYLKSQKADELAMKEVLLQSAQETYDFANQLPHIDTRYDELQVALEVVEGDAKKSAILNQEEQQKIEQALKESLGQATVTLQSNGVWQDTLPPICEQLLEHEATATVLADLAQHVRQPPLFIDSDKHSAVIAIGHEKYARLTLTNGQEKLEQKPALEPLHQNQVDDVKCEIFSAAKIDNAKLLASLTTHDHKEEKALDKAIGQDLQATVSKQQEIVKERELALGQELEIGWDD